MANTTNTIAINPNARPSAVFVSSFLLMGRSGATALPASRTIPDVSCVEICVSLTFCDKVVYTV